MNDVLAILLAVVLLAGNAFFVGAEFALIAARRTQIEHRALAGSGPARVTLRAMDEVSLMMAGAQLGITVCSLGLGAVGEPAVAHLLEVPFEAAGLPDQLVHPVALVIALSIVVSLHMVLGEMVPKNIALAGPERSALALGPPLYAVVRVLRPLIVLLNLLANAGLRLARVTPRDEVASVYTQEEVGGLVDESRREGLLDDMEHDLVSGALTFGDRRARDVTLAPDTLVTLPVTVTPAVVQATTGSTGHSRFPLTEATPGAAPGSAGYVHVKDVLGLSDQDSPLPPMAIRRPVTVDANDSLQRVLQRMQESGAHMARVVDREGGTGDAGSTGSTGSRLVGLAMLEDVVEQLVGEVRQT